MKSYPTGREGSASSTLTPGMAKLGAESEGCSKDQLRKLVQDSLDKQLYSTAIFFAERLSRCKSALVSDHIIFAKCFLLSGEHRRCLATLQNKGLLQVTVIAPLGDALRPHKSTASFLTPVQLRHLEAVLLAASCLHHLHEFEDCLTLLESLVDLEEGRSGSGGEVVAVHCLALLANQPSQVHVMAALYCLVGKCYDALDHRVRALRSFSTALRIDPACTEVVEYMAKRGMLSLQEKKNLLQKVITLKDHPGKSWLEPYYSFMLGGKSPECLDLICTDENGKVDEAVETSALSLVCQAEYLYRSECVEDAFRVASRAYLIDPYDLRGNLIYIGTMVDLSLKNELFYLGHELVHSHPKHAISWYTVGCYYWTCKKFELAQKYLQKTTKMDKRFAHAWMLLGHVLAAQEESEHAISAYRTACRIAPGDLSPQIAMAKELVRTSNFSLALHVLSEARTHGPTDPGVLNELGVVYMHLGRLQEAMKHLRKAAEIVTSPTQSARRGSSSETGGVVEILSNYGTCLRKCGMFEKALDWYQNCLSYRPNDPITHANIGFTLHLSKRFDEAVDQYHRALSLQPAFSFCSDMLTQALTDMSSFPSCTTSDSLAFSQNDNSKVPQSQEGVFQKPNIIEALFMPTHQASRHISLPGVSEEGQSLLLSPCEGRGVADKFEQRDGVQLLERDFYRSQEHGFDSVHERISLSYDGDCSPLYPRHYNDEQKMGDTSRSRLSYGNSSNMSWDEDSVESYSRIAGRLSMTSAMSNES